MKWPVDKYVKVGGINTRYWAEGEGRPIVLVHGIGGYVENWLPCLNALTESYRVYAADLMGMGRTDKPRAASYSISSLAQFIKDFMSTLEIERAHLAGHSLGGAIVLRFTLMFGQCVDTLALVNSAGLGRGAGLALRLGALPVLGSLFTHPSRAGTRLMLKMMAHDPGVITEKLCDEYYQMASLPGNQHCFLKTLRENGNFFGQSEKLYGPHVRGLATIMKPVLLVSGRHDRIMPAAHVRAAAKCLPKAHLHIFDDCGHLPMFEKTREFNELLLGFLKESRRRGAENSSENLG